LNKKVREELERVENIYRNIIDSIHGAAEKALRNKKEIFRRNIKLWWTDKIDQLVKEKRHLKWLN